MINMNRQQSSVIVQLRLVSPGCLCGLLSHTTLQMQTQVVDSEYNIKEVEHLSSVIFCFSVTDISHANTVMQQHDIRLAAEVM